MFRIASALLLAAVFLGLSLTPVPAGFEEELIYQGRTLRDWLADLRSKDEAVRLRASRVLRLVGPEADDAAPALLLALRNDDLTVRFRLAQALARIGPRQVPLLTAALSFDDDRMASGAALALGYLGPTHARPAGRALIRQLKAASPVTRSCVALSLWRTHRDARGVEVLRQGLKGKAFESAWSAWALVRMGAASAPALPEVMALLGDESANQRDWAFNLFGNTGAKAVPVLHKALESKSPRVRIEAAEALGRLGPLADAAVPELVKQLSDPLPGPRVAAARALGRIGLSDDGILSGLQTSLRDSDRDVREVAAVALGELGPRAAAAVPGLTRLLHDPEGRVVQATFRAIVQIGKPAVGTLVKQLKEKDEFVRRQALKALRDIGPDAAEAVPVLTGLLKDANTSFRLAVVEALDGMARPVREALIEALQDKNTQRRLDALRALGGMGPDAGTCLTALTKVYDEEPACRIKVFRTLARVGESVKAALPLVRRGLEEKNVPGKEGVLELRTQVVKFLATEPAEARASGELEAIARKNIVEAPGELAARLLIACGEQKRVIPRLTQALKGAAGPSRYSAASLVPALGPAGKELLPLLKKNMAEKNEDRLPAAWAVWTLDPSADVLSVLEGELEDKQAFRRIAVLRMLARMGSAAHPAIPTVTKILSKDADLGVRVQAARTLGAMGPDARDGLPGLLQLLLDLGRIHDMDQDEVRDNLNKPTLAMLRLRSAWLPGTQHMRVLQAMGAIHKQGSSAMPQVEAVLDDGLLQHRQDVLDAIAQIGPAVVPLASKDLQSELVEARLRGARVLARLGPRARAAVEELRKALSDPSPTVAVEAARALHTVTGEREAIVPVLMRCLDSSSIAAARTLGELGPAARSATPALLDALDDTNAKLRAAAAKALGLIDPDVKLVRPVLERRLRDRDQAVRIAAALTLGRLDERFDPVPVLRQALRTSSEYGVRIAALNGLATLGPRAKPALPLVRIVCRDRDALTSLKATQLCFDLGDKSAGEVDRLVTLALSRDDRPEWRIQALELLARMGKAARVARLGLLTLLDEPDNVVATARKTLVAMDGN